MQNGYAYAVTPHGFKFRKRLLWMNYEQTKKFMEEKGYQLGPFIPFS